MRQERLLIRAEGPLQSPRSDPVPRDPYEALADAIVLQAVKDWRRATRKLKKYPTAWSAKHLKKDAEKFFRSDWFKNLTSVDGEYILMRLKEEDE